MRVVVLVASAEAIGQLVRLISGRDKDELLACRPQACEVRRS
jgi:hypothetical protein